ASPSNGAEERKIVLRENQARHFALSGVSKVPDSVEKFARFSQPLALDHFSPVTEYVHWSFDDKDGESFRADGFGRRLSGFDALLVSSAAEPTRDIHAQGRHEGCLRLDGSFFTRAALPRLSGDVSHTLGFWVKVPEDAQ